MLISFSPIAAIQDDGSMDAASVVNELSINGNGYFVVRDPVTNKRYATQAGDFSLDTNGYMVTGSGARLQGRTGGTHSRIGDLQINICGTLRKSVHEICYSIDDRGKITVHLSDGSQLVRGQLMLQNFRDPEALVNEGNHLYSNMSAAGPLPALAPPGTRGLGLIDWGVLELSSVLSPYWAN